MHTPPLSADTVGLISAENYGSLQSAAVEQQNRRPRLVEDFNASA